MHLEGVWTLPDSGVLRWLVAGEPLIERAERPTCHRKSWPAFADGRFRPKAAPAVGARRFSRLGCTSTCWATQPTIRSNCTKGQPVIRRTVNKSHIRVRGPGFKRVRDDMTLVIAGMKDNETAFFCADSTISSNGRTLLGGFRKIYSIPVITWQPYFIGETFKDYLQEHTSTQCVIAFSGNTLTAQHLLNSITSHLSKLRLSWCSTKASYVILRHCDARNELFKDGHLWDESMFLGSDFQGLLTCGLIFDIILYSVNEAISSARKYKLDQDGYNSLTTAFIAAAYDPARRQAKLARFDMKSEISEDGYLKPVFELTHLSNQDVSQIGDSHLIGEQDEIRRISERDGVSIDHASFKHLLEKIDSSLDEGRRSVDYPAVMKHFKSGELSVVRRVKSR